MKYNVNCETEIVNSTFNTLNCSGQVLHENLVLQLGAVFVLGVLAFLGARKIYMDLKNWLDSDE